jgi:all-trans-retinol 13,14-reductase
MAHTSYKRVTDLNAYDAILIGSGIGSLVTAAALSKAGKRCLVLERHYAPGGYTHTFKRKQYEWDVGVHYIGEVMRSESLLARLFRYIGDGTLEWADMGEVYDRIRFGDEVFDFVKGRQAWTDRLKQYFPDQKDCKAIDQYVELVQVAAREARGFFAEKALPVLASQVAGGMMRRGFMKFAGRTTLDVLKSITDNPKLIAVLTGQYGDYGLPPSQSSFAMHASVVRHYFNGGAYPVGGSARIYESILPLIEEAGGQVLINAEVKQVLVRKGKAIGVLMADDREITAPIVISGAGLATTAHQLLAEEDRKRSGLEKSLRKVESSASHLCLYLGFKGRVDELELPKANWWYYPAEFDHDSLVAKFNADTSAEFPVIYVSFPAAKDPTWHDRFPDRSTVEVITVASFDQFAPWLDTRWHKRGEEYEALKSDLSERMLEKLYDLEPQLRGHLDHCELSTPLSTRHFCNYEHGEIYGLQHDPQRFGVKSLRPATGVKGLYLTGQDVATAGVGGAMVGGILCASVVLKRNLMNEVIGS